MAQARKTNHSPQAGKAAQYQQTAGTGFEGKPSRKATADMVGDALADSPSRGE